MRHKFRLGRGARWLPALGATAALAIAPSVASAQNGDPAALAPTWDAQTTNVPYLGWEGEEIRLERCLPITVTFDDALSVVGITDITDDSFVPLAESDTPAFNVEDWSNSSVQQPTVVQNTVKAFLTDDYDGFYPALCFEGDVVAEHSGLARVELDVTSNDTELLQALGVTIETENEILNNQFLAGWLKLNSPTLSEMSAANFGDSADAAKTIGDPSGSGTYQAGANDGYLDVKVTGSLPTGGWQGLPSSITLPNDYVEMAQALAVTSNPTYNAAPYTPADTWDIAGDSNDTEGHVTQSPVDCLADPFTGIPLEAATSTTYALLDNGDNCYGGAGSEDGPFSTAFGIPSNAGTSVGPYDSVDQFDTLLPDGNLSSQDAPMPSARVDVAIAPNSGAAGDISGVGSLEAADKDVTYSRDFTGTATTPHNLYAPFYDEYLPATARGSVSSGIDGAYGTGNFQNFLDPTGEYHFWDTYTQQANTATATSCLHESANPETDSPLTNPGDYYQTPSGASDVAVYTDQNGEAQVKYDPGTGFYFDNVSGIIKNGDGGCDLQALLGQPLGTSAITATAKYPYQPGDDGSTVSNVVTKTVTSDWSKTLAYYPKGAGAANANARIVVAHAQDIDGSPFVGETVCFVAGPDEGLVFFDGTAGGISFADTTEVADPKGSGRLCVDTDAFGNAAVEVLDSNGDTTDVVADFTNEGLLRDIPVPFGSGAPTTGGTPPPSGETPGQPTVGTTAATTSTSTSTPAGTVSVTAGTAAPKTTSLVTEGAAKKAHTAKTLIEELRLLSPSHGKHYVLVRVKSSAKHVKLRLTLVSKFATTASKHHAHSSTRVETITVATNRLVKIHIAKTVSKIKEARLG